MPASSVASWRTAARLLRASGANRERKVGLKPLDVSGVDERCLIALGGPKPGLHRFLRTSNDSMENPHHSSSSVALDDLSDHEALRQKEPGTSSPSGAKRLAQIGRASCRERV